MDDIIDCFGIHAKEKIPKKWKYPIQFAYWVSLEYPEIRKEYDKIVKEEII